MNKNEAEAVIKDTIKYANKEIEKNKKKARRWIIVVIIGFAMLFVAGIVFVKLNAPVENDRNITTIREYSKNSDGTWECEGNTYRYRLEISGRMHNAAIDSTYVYLSNNADITFEQAWKAAGFSSNLGNYFDFQEAVLVEMSTE